MFQLPYRFRKPRNLIRPIPCLRHKQSSLLRHPTGSTPGFSPHGNDPIYLDEFGGEGWLGLGDGPFDKTAGFI